MSPDGAPAVRDYRIDSGDASLYVEVCGEGQPLLLLHGWTLDHRSFAPQVAALSRSMRIIVPDRRGCGLSSGTPSLEAELSDIDRLLNELVQEPVHLLGVSQGGRLALRYAATRPGRLRSLILQGAVLDGFSAPDGPGEAIPLARFTRLADEGQIEQMRQEWLQHPMMSAGVDAPAQRDRLRDIVADYRGDDLRERARLAADDLTGLLSTLPVAVLIVTGELEVQARKAHAAKLLELLPHAREVVIEGAGHLSNFSHPDRYNALVRDFCRRVVGGDR